MSFKYQVDQISSNHYVLPKMGDMKIEVHAFLSEKLYDSSEEEMWKQIYNMSCISGVIGAYLMPDSHLGFGSPIGSVIITESTLIQACSGYDISCGVIYLKLKNATAETVKDRYPRERWITELEKRIAFGKGSDRPKLAPKYTKSKGDEILRFGAKAIDISVDLCERQYIPIPDNLQLDKIEKAYSKVLPQIGSVGGGNHFIEMQVDKDDGSVWVMVHCGSRGFGWQTANHFFYEGANLRNIPKNRREESWLDIGEPLGKEYWNYHNAAANFAIANRHVIVKAIQETIQEVFNVDSEVYYEISHNLVQEETVFLPDGTSKKGFVHRKGATRAFPAGHPDLVGTIWEQTGHPCLISGSMISGGAILFPCEGAKLSGCSVNHGSGRVLARGEAKRKLGHKQDKIDDEMRYVRRNFGGIEIQGIVSNCTKIPLDESGEVYKNLDEVLAVLENEGIAKINRRLFPIANLKGMD